MPSGTPQIRPQSAQNQASSSPFANPPAGSPAANSNIRPVNPTAPMRPPMPIQHNPSGASMNMNRPPMPRPPMTAVRPPFPSGQAIANGVPLPMRPPVPQSPSVQGVLRGPFANPPTPQNSTPQMAQPPMPQMQEGLSSTINGMNQRPPMMRPPIPASQSPQAPPVQAYRPSMMQNPQANAALRPTMPQPSPPTSGHTPQAQISRPPPMQMRPPITSPQAQPTPMRPPMSSIPLTRPMTPNSQAPVRPSFPSAPMQARPPIPGNTGLNQPVNQFPPQMRPLMPMPSYPTAPSAGPQVPVMPFPSMKYPVGPGYVQQQQLPSQPPMQPAMQPVMQQQPAYPQTMPPTQQPYPSYPQAPNAQNVPQYPSQNYSGGNLAPQQPVAPKVNPAAIPSVVAVLEADELRFKETSQPFYTFSSVVDNPPPLPTTRSVSIVDDGNSSPQFIRSTLNHIPVSEEICENTKIPLSLVIQPFANTPQTEVPLVDFGTSGPLRCNRCRAYINPHVQFIKGGRFYVCNLCDMSNEVSEEYYANLDMSGKRIDLDLRPELKFGTVDFVASKVKPYLILFINSF